MVNSRGRRWRDQRETITVAEAVEAAASAARCMEVLTTERIRLAAELALPVDRRSIELRPTEADRRRAEPRRPRGNPDKGAT